MDKKMCKTGHIRVKKLSLYCERRRSHIKPFIPEITSGKRVSAGAVQQPFKIDKWLKAGTVYSYRKSLTAKSFLHSPY